MAEQPICPRCGSPLPGREPLGLCPRCLWPSGLDREPFGLDQSGEVGATVDLGGPPSALQTLASTVGSVPRVLLRDTDTESEPPVHRPGSPEMPGPADRAARLRLLGEIARGGMGAVLKGRDEDLGRDLAVKVLLEQHRDNPELIRRFIEEAQIGGQLQHPGVVPIYELGTFADRRPYFAMKLVKGRTLTELLAARSDPADGLPRFLGIFEQVCQTIAYAHARGVIHRDLKPSNIMVGGFGEVQVMDWGLAKVLPRGGATDDAGAGREPDAVTVIATARSDGDVNHSRAGSVMGTPAYMAPEQARGEVGRIDERADVFALGSILAETLTGSPAFVGRTSGEIHRRAARGETAEAVARLLACGADAELVALARDCLAAEPEDRTRDASAVSRRLNAYLTGVQERLRNAEIERARAEARAAEERKRRKLQLGLAASVLALTAVGGLGFTYLLQQRQARAAELGRRLASAGALLAEADDDREDPACWQKALVSLDLAADLARHDPEAAGRVGVLLARARAGLHDAESAQRLGQALDEVRAGLFDVGAAGTDAAYARAFAAEGLHPDASTVAEAAEALRDRMPGRLVELAAALDHWASTRHEGGGESDAWRRLLALSGAIDPDPYRVEIRTILAGTGSDPERARLRTLALDPRAEALPPASATLLARALVSSREAETAVELLRKSQNRHPDDLWINYDLAASLLALEPPQINEAIRFLTAARVARPTAAHWLGDALGDAGRAAEAVEVFRDLERRRPDDLAHAVCLGETLQHLGRESEARAALERALEAGRRAIRANPDDVLTHHHLGLALHHLGRNEEAVTELREAIRLNPRFAEPLVALGVVLSALGRPDEAIAADREALRLDPRNLYARANLASELQYRGDDQEAIAEFRDLVRRVPHLAGIRYNLGNALDRSGDHEAAIAAYREALRLDPEHVEVRINLGISLGKAGRLDEAADTLREAARRRPDHLKAWTNLAKALGEQGAVDDLREAIASRPDVPELHDWLAHALIHQDRYAEAVAPLREVGRLRPNDPEVRHELGKVLDALEDFAAAAAAYRDAIRLRPDFPEAREAMAMALFRDGRSEEAADAYRESIRLHPERANGHYGLATIDLVEDRIEPAIAGFREAIRLDPDLAEAHCNLGHALQRAGDFAGSLDQLRIGHELGSKRPGWSYPSAEWVADAERLARLADRLPAVLSGQAQPADLAERLALGQFAYDTRRYAVAARLWAGAPEADPTLAHDRRTQPLYNAACAAALAAAGADRDDPMPDESARADLRRQALGWLKSELAAWSDLLDSDDPNARAEVAPTLHHWQEDPDLASVHDPDALVALADAERAEWHALWAEVDRLLKYAERR